MPVVTTVDDGSILAELPIHRSDGVAASFPSVEEARVDAGVVKKAVPSSPDRDGHHQGCTRRGRILLALGLTFLAVVIILGVTLGMFNAQQKAPSQADYNGGSQTTNGDGAAEGKREADFQGVIGYLSSAGVSTMESLLDVGSPQHMAAKWLADDDGLNLPVPQQQATTEAGYSYVTRYVLAVLYFGMDGPSWTRDFSFVSGRDVCVWNDPVTATLSSGEETTLPGGVYCDGATGVVSSIHLGTFATGF